MARIDRLERLADLVLVLLDAPSPLTLDEIADQLPGYPSDHEARRQAFERDKRTLREAGIPVTAIPIDSPAQFGYRIVEDDYLLPDLDLDPEEQAALNVAVAGVHLDHGSARDALESLGAFGTVPAAPVVSLSAVPGLGPLYEALRARREVRFSYGGHDRRVWPLSLAFRGGHWYLVAQEAGSGESRTFRVDRMAGPPRLGEAAAPAADGPLRPTEIGAPGDPPGRPWGLAPIGQSEAIGTARVRVDAVEARRIEAVVGGAGVLARDAGGIELEVGVSTEPMFRSWVLGLGGHAEVLAPADLRDGLRAWLEAIVGAPAPPEPALRRTAEVPGGTPGVGTTGRREPSGGGAATERDPNARLRRLLAIVSYLARQGKASIDDLSRRFAMDQADLVRELEMAACCGVPPYSPDALLEIIVSDTDVEAFLPERFSRPRRLTPSEGFALAASARAILAIPGSDMEGALARAVAKLDRVLGGVAAVVVDVPAPPLLAEIRPLVERGARVEITYHAASSDETTVRRVDPTALTMIEGTWYLDGHCHHAGGHRRFRVDRISSLVEVPGGQRGSGATGQPIPEVPLRSFVPGPDARTVRLLLGPGARWVADSIPTVAVDEAGEAGAVVTAEVGGTAWLARLLLQAGPEAAVLSPPDLVDAGRDAARALLERYRMERHEVH